MLKKIMILTDLSEVREQLQGLADRLRPDGICPELLPEEALPAALVQEDLTETIFLVGRQKDCRLVLAAGGYVLLFLHEGNREESFPEVRYALEGLEGVDGGYLELVYRRFRGLPWTICETKRCLVREFTEEDLEALEEIFSEPQAGPYLAAPEIREPQETALCSIRTYIDRIYGFYGYGIWLILDKRTREPVGCAGFSVRPGAPAPELGFIIKKNRRRKGYAYEVCLALLDFARNELGFEQAAALAGRENRASAGLLKKLGFAGPYTDAGERKECGCDRYIRSFIDI